MKKNENIERLKESFNVMIESIEFRKRKMTTVEQIVLIDMYKCIIELSFPAPGRKKKKVVGGSFSL